MFRALRAYHRAGRARAAAASVTVALCICGWMAAQDTKYPPQGQQFPGPPSKAETADWLREIQQYREERRLRAGLTGEIYQRSELEWTQRSFIQPQSMIEDRYFYDPAERRYTVERLLADLDTR